MNFCLGLEILGNCSNFYNNEFTVFNIGVFLALIGVFFTGFQLMNEAHKIRLSVRVNRENLVFLLILPILFITISTILPYIPGDALPLLGYRIFWEIITALYIIIFGTYLIFGIFLNPIKTFDRKSDILSNIYISKISKNKDIDILVDEFSFFFHSFIKNYEEFQKLVRKDYNSKIFKTEGLTKKELKIFKHNYSEQFLLIIENKRFVKQIIIKPSILDKIISYYIKVNHQISYHEQNFLSNIILESIADENSLLAHELEGEIKFNHNKGIILNKIITNVNFLEKINLYSSFYKYYDDIDFSERFLKFSSYLIDEFLNLDSLEKNYNKYKFLYEIFKENSRIIFQHFKNFDHLMKHDFLPSQFNYNIGKINDKLLELYKGEFPRIHIEDREYREYDSHNSNISLIDALAFGLFEYIIYLSASKEKDIRRYSIECSFYGVNYGGDKQIYVEIENRILLLFKNQIKENLKGIGPMVSKIFFENYFWHIINNENEVKKDTRIMDILKLYSLNLGEVKKGFVYGNTRETIKGKVLKAKNEGDKIIKELLPEYIEYNQKNNTLIILPKYGIDSYILYLNKIKQGKIYIKKV